jgi:hypothetical protein
MNKTDPDLDPLVSGTDPRIRSRIRTKKCHGFTTLVFGNPTDRRHWRVLNLPRFSRFAQALEEYLYL